MNTGSTNQNEAKEIALMSYMIIRSEAALQRLIESVRSHYGIIPLNDETRKLYRDLRYYILSIRERMDMQLSEEFIIDNDLFMGMSVATLFPNEIDDIDKGNNPAAYKADDLLEELSSDKWIFDNRVVGNFTDNDSLEIDITLQRILDKAESVIRNNSKAKEYYLEPIRSSSEAILRLHVDDISKEIDFSYIDDSKLKELLIANLKKCMEAYENGLFLSTTILSRSIIEAILVYTLKKLPDAQISYFEKYKNQEEISQLKRRASNIEKWHMPDLIEIASQNKVIRMEYLDKLLTNLNRYRNAIHIYTIMRDPIEIDERAAHRSLSVLAYFNKDIKRWYDEMQ